MKLQNLKPSVRVLDTSIARNIPDGTKRPAWHTVKKRTLTGRPWRRKRERILQRDSYLCQECRRRGLVTVAAEVDHITPLSQGGDDDDGNLQSLCKRCHQIKTIIETPGGAQTHPDWLPIPSCHVVLITGPAGSGKTTYAIRAKRMFDVVIDLDECFYDVCGVHGHQADRAHLNNALRWRNRQIADLKSKTDGIAYVIVSSPTNKEIKWWRSKLHAEHVLCDPGIEEIRRRIGRDNRRMTAVLEWYEKRDHS